ncbi:MAG: hypothetical protein M3H12_12760 [Chromatiales bacterium]
MPNHLTLLTGPIVGLRSTWFIQDTIRFARKLGETIVAFDLFDEILRLEGMEAKDAFDKASWIGELLDGYDYRFRDLREKAYLSIARQVDALDADTSVVVRTPAAIEWRGVVNELKDHRIIADVLRPDRVVTLIDAEWKIQAHLGTAYGQHALTTIAHQQELDIPHILYWLGREVSRSEDWAEWFRQLTGKPVRHIVLGVECPGPHDRGRYIRDVENLAKLIIEPDLPIFYASYSMTVADESVRQAVHEAVWRLRGYGVVIDPASIELGDQVQAEHRDVVFAYTVCRDLRWDVHKVDIVAAFHPYPDRPPLSTGMMDELGHARAYRKERYLILPKGGGSPFTGDNYVPGDHVFKDVDSFFRHLEQGRNPPLKARFAHYQSHLPTPRGNKG